MKNKIKIITAIAISAILAVSSFAAGTLISINVDPSIKILVNGEEFRPKDANGNDVMTFTYNGTTYAPLRALAEAYGLEVGYDAERRMATVGSIPNEIPSSGDNKSYGTTLGEQNALKQALSYLKYSAFSYEGLINQLEYEGYTNSEALYGVDNCGADWYMQAVLCAKNYINYSAFSYIGLVKQLEYEGFTNDQATYGVDNCEADWYEQAVKSAANYLSYSAFSKDGLIKQLEYEGFTTEQAEYGVSQNGY